MGDPIHWLEDVQQAPGRLPRRTPKLTSLLSREDGRRVESLSDWLVRREAIRRWWSDFLGPLEVGRGAPPVFEILEEDRLAGVVRQHIRYAVEPDEPVEAYLLKPLAVAAPCPGLIALHSTVAQTIRQPAGLEGEPEKAFGLWAAQRGWVAICPRCYLWSGRPVNRYRRHWRRFALRHPRAKGMAKMLHDAQVALDLLETLPEVDPRRLGAIGHSLGAKEVLYLAALDERVRAAVSSEGGIGLRFSNWHAPWYLGRSIRRRGFAHDHHELLALVAPRAFLLVGGDSADGARSWPYLESVLPIYRLYGNHLPVGLLNHERGHLVPSEALVRAGQWLNAFL